MALKRITLTLGERYILALALRRVPKADLATAKQVREIKRRLDLRQAVNTVDKLNERSAEFGLGVEWSDLGESLQPFIERVDDFIDEENVAEERDKLEALKKRSQGASPEREFTIDEAYLKWVRDELFEKLDWSKAKLQDERGIAHEVDVLVSPDQLDVYADMADKVNGSIAAKSVSEEREKPGKE